MKRVRSIVAVITLLVLASTSLPGWAGSARSQMESHQLESRDRQPTSPGDALSEVIHFDRLSIEDGLSQSTIRSIQQDRIGFMWIGTDDGLNKYDGYEFTIYRHEQDNPASLASSTILALYEDQQGELWIGTTAGLDRIERQSGRFIHVEPQLIRQPVTAIAEGEAGQLWVGMDGGGALRLDPQTGESQVYRHDPHNPASLADDTVRQIFRTAHGETWVATDAGLDRFIRETGEFDHLRHEKSDPNTPSFDQIRAIAEGRDEGLWVGTAGGGLNLFDWETKRFTFYLSSTVDTASISDNQVQTILVDSHGWLWVGTRQGLNLFNEDTGKFTRYWHDPGDGASLGGSRILSLYEDRSGVVWVGTEGAGLSLYKPSAHKFRLYRLSPAENGESSAISAILEDQSGRLWLGTLEKGLWMIERRDKSAVFTQQNPADNSSLGQAPIISLVADHSGRLWVGFSGRGLADWDENTRQFTRYRYVYSDPNSLSSDIVQSLYEDPSHRLWVGTDGSGLNRLEGDGQFTHFHHDPADPSTLASDRIQMIGGDRQGSIWVGTVHSGLSVLDPLTGRFRTFRHDPADSNSLTSDEITAIHTDKNETVWVGTKAGLNRYDPGSNGFKRYNFMDSQLSNMVSCIQSDDQGILWISSVDSLLRFDPDLETVKRYTVDDGLQAEEFIQSSCFRSQSGELFFGGGQGLNAFYPDEVLDNPIPPPVVVNAFKKFNRTVQRDLSQDEFLELSYQDNFISFEFAALDYNAPDKNQYAYYLEGFDQDWVSAGNQRVAIYTNLKGGDYTFRVRAANSDGIWNEAGTAIHIRVQPPFWENAWFRLLSVFGMIGLLAAVYQIRIKSIQARNRELETRVLALSAELERNAVAAERHRLARDLHDSVTQSLYSLTLMLEAGQRLLEGGELPKSSDLLARGGEVAQQALQEMRLMVYQLRPPALEKTGLADALAHRLEAVERRAGLEARLIVEELDDFPEPLEDGLYQIAMEALNNALKHSKADVVTLRLAAREGAVLLEVSDNGRGFDPRSVPSGGMGLVSMHERAVQLGGRLDVRSTLGSGTVIRFTLGRQTESGEIDEEVALSA